MERWQKVRKTGSTSLNLDHDHDQNHDLPTQDAHHVLVHRFHWHRLHSRSSLGRLRDFIRSTLEARNAQQAQHQGRDDDMMTTPPRVRHVINLVRRRDELQEEELERERATTLDAKKFPLPSTAKRISCETNFYNPGSTSSLHSGVPHGIHFDHNKRSTAPETRLD